MRFWYLLHLQAALAPMSLHKGAVSPKPLLFALTYNICLYSKTCLKRPLSKRPKIGFQDQLSLNAGQKYCRMLQQEHSAILLPFIKLPIVIKIVVVSTFEWLFYTGCTVHEGWGQNLGI